MNKESGIFRLRSGQGRNQGKLKTIIHNSLFMIHLRKGFTFIELIVVFTTIAFLSIVGIASYVSYGQSQTLQAATQDLVTTIQLAKSRANSQVKPPSSFCVGQLDGYSVVLSIASSTYALSVKCGGNASVALQTTKLLSNITFDGATTNVSELFFAVITGAVEGYGNIFMSGYGKTKKITIDNVGVIKVE